MHNYFAITGRICDGVINVTLQMSVSKNNKCVYIPYRGHQKWRDSEKLNLSYLQSPINVKLCMGNNITMLIIKNPKNII